MARPRKDERIHQTVSVPGCSETVVHDDAVRNAKQSLPEPDAVSAMTDLFAALGDPTRLRIVAALSAGRLCVCDISATVGLTQSATSHQLRVLRDRGLVSSRREGRMVYYSLDDDHVASLYEQALDHVGHVYAEQNEELVA